MIKKSIYPKTERVSEKGDYICLTEKIDGSNLVFFKKDGELWFAQRKTLIPLSEIDECRDIMYKGLYQFLKDNGSQLKENLHDNSALCGEWMGMGSTKYPEGTFDKKWYMFAKANIDENLELFNFKYNHDLFIYPFIDQVFPSFLGIVPTVCEIQTLPNKEMLDSIYKEYTQKVDRPVEGFVINYRDIISKYVRLKDGKLAEYSQEDHKSSAS